MVVVVNDAGECWFHRLRKRLQAHEDDFSQGYAKLVVL